ncbi:MAG: YeeE/YedE family protein [Gammaproteobacteria bacterium]|nr:YeeE/YedE family protein [Gammaproteobacteria bacterium]
MEFTIHYQILMWVFLIAVVMGAVANKTNFCTMGAVSDWVNIGDTGRLRAWLLAMTVALIGVLALEASGIVTLPGDTFPPYRTANFSWLRYLLGGVLFGIGMTLGSGCGNKTFVRIGGGNLKSLVLLAAFAGPAAYWMLWGEIGGQGFYTLFFEGWIQPTAIDLAARNIQSQELGAIVGGLFGMPDVAKLHLIVGAAIAVAMLGFIFKSADFRASADNILGGAVIGLAVVAGWWITGGALGREWLDWAQLEPESPSRVAVQSYTFISPMGDTARYLLTPTNTLFINYGVMALTGVILGSFLYTVVTRKFRIEWFVNAKDFLMHAVGGVLMGVGGVLSMGCTIGQGVTGVSTLALGSILTFVAIVFGSALTMKTQYYLLDEKGFIDALRHGLADMKLLPKPKAA